MRYWPWLLGGFGLLGLSKVVEGIGDGFPLAAEGASPERLVFHLLALAALLAGLTCFLGAARGIVRALRRSKVAGPAEAARSTAPGDSLTAPSEFDADAALARYLERKRDPADAPPPAPRKPASGFGRRGL